MLSYKNIAVIGCGTIGLGWAACFASHGLIVNLYDQQQQSLNQAKDKIQNILSSLHEINYISDEQAKQALVNLQICPELEIALKGVDFVQESIYENYEAKKALYKQMDALLPPEIVIASSSSGLLMTEIQKDVDKHPERCLIGHPINPVYLIPLVEMVPGEQTGQQFMQQAKSFYESIEKVPVTLKKEVPGYLENRITAALWREAIDLVINDVATVEDIDKTIYAGPGLRYALMGPHLIYHLGGGQGGIEYFIDHLGEAFTQWWTDMNCWTKFPEGAAQKLSAGMGDCMHGKSIAEICAWRDKKLVELLKTIDINKSF